MTTLVTWVGADSRGPASIYLASDSRITWPGIGPWDYGRKLFATRREPHILGYCGDVLFPTQVLGQVVEMIDDGLLFEPGTDPDDCLNRILDILGDSLHGYPASVAQDFSILYVTRSGEGMTCAFNLTEARFQNRVLIEAKWISLPSQSGVVAILGSGKEALNQSLKRWQDSEVGGTSRSVFSALCDALHEGVDPNSGGPPQLVGLYRKGGGKTFGLIWNGSRYFYGTKIQHFVDVKAVQWHNELFEISDPQSLDRRRNSQSQPRPRSVSGPPK